MQNQQSANRFITLALLSGASLLLEISLTRIFSVVFYPPYVFAVLALAILGIGLGAALATWRARLRAAEMPPLYIVLIGVTALLLLGTTILTAANDLRPLLVILLILPYFFIGLALTSIFSNHAAESTTLYMADLLGAGLGAALAIPIMDAVNPLNGALVAIVLFGLAAYSAHPRGLPLLQIAFTLFVLVLLGGNLVAKWFTLDITTLYTEKPVQEGLGLLGQVIETRWDSFARTDLIEPGDGGPLRLYLDGAAGSIMPPAQSNDFLLRDIGFFPFATDQPEKVLIVGPGGGLDVWFALRSGAQEIVAVEVNPQSVALVEEYASYNGDLYAAPNVKIVVDEGRSLLQRDKTLYDLIFLSQVVTLTAERTGYALTENTIYTVEAFREYLAHLTPDGVIALKLYDDITAERALSTILAALREEGMSDAEGLRHLLVLADPSNEPPIPLLMLRKSAYTRDDSLVYGRILRDLNFTPLFLPELWIQPPLDAIWDGTKTFSAVVADSDSDISPTTDNRPFFYQFERGLPADLQILWAILAAVALGASLLLVYSQRTLTLRSLRITPLYFAGLGIGFIMIEVALIQQTRLFLGHPTLAVTTTLGTLLIGGGIGSGIAGRWLAKRLPIALLISALVFILLLWMLLWPGLSQSLLGADLMLRLLSVMLSLLPLALLMGMPFALGLRAVGTISTQQVALAWAVNGVATVLGTVGAVTLAILSGFNAVLLAGAAAYLLAAVFAHFSLRNLSTAEPPLL